MPDGEGDTPEAKDCKTAIGDLGDKLCKECFFLCFEMEIHETIRSTRMFRAGQKVVIGASGGKDSTVLAYVMKLLNERHRYGLDLYLLSIDEGIAGYRDDSLDTVKKNEDQYGIPLTILSYADLYQGWTMDKIVAKIGKKSNCTFCGVFRRQALDRGAALIHQRNPSSATATSTTSDHSSPPPPPPVVIATGHNADDLAETVLMNVLRGDVARLQRSMANVTGDRGETTGCGSGGGGAAGSLDDDDLASSSSAAAATAPLLPRCKPLKYCYEKEIVMYAHFKSLLYFSTECPHAPNSYRGFVRAFLKQLEAIRPSAILDIIHSGECLTLEDEVARRLPAQGTCARCGLISSQAICKACVMLEGLAKDLPRLGITKSSKIKRMIRESEPNGVLDPDDQRSSRGSDPPTDCGSGGGKTCGCSSENADKYSF